MPPIFYPPPGPYLGARQPYEDDKLAIDLITGPPGSDPGSAPLTVVGWPPWRGSFRGVSRGA